MPSKEKYLYWLLIHATDPLDMNNSGVRKKRRTPNTNTKQNRKDTIAENKTLRLLHAMSLKLLVVGVVVGVAIAIAIAGGGAYVAARKEINSRFGNGSMKKHFEMTMLSLANFIISRFMTLNLNNHALQTHRFTTLYTQSPRHF